MMIEDYEFEDCETIDKSLYARLLVLFKRLRARLQKLKERYMWRLHARKNQREPEGKWRTWMILAGRGFGKTRTGAETIRQWIDSGRCRRIALVGETEADVRQVMVEGESGLLSIYPEDERPTYNPSKREITWPNGAIATCYSAEAYEQLRGPQFDGAWVDELAKFKSPEDVWDQLMLGLRLGHDPRVIVTTTPRNIPLIKSLVKSTSVTVTRGSTFENAKNLASSFMDYVKENYQHSALGKQEVYGEILEDNTGALWTRSMIDKACKPEEPTPLQRIVVAIDPAVTSGKKSDETGIVVAGLTEHNKAVILEDISGKYTPTEWANVAVEAYHRHQADRVVAEVNQGGDLVETLLRQVDSSVSYQSVRATRGKLLRAEPIASLYEQGKVHHAQRLTKLEEQMLSYTRTSHSSPDRLDALVWALTDLCLGDVPTKKFHFWKS